MLAPVRDPFSHWVNGDAHLLFTILMHNDNYDD